MNRIPSLRGSQLRISRAYRYIQEIDGLIQGFGNECEDRIVRQNQSMLNTAIEFPAIPEDLPLAISDSIHNLRASLDYLVFELAFKDSGIIQDGTQFPIEDCKSGKSSSNRDIGFDSIVERRLNGICQPHRDMIESLQPYRGNKWAETLRDISNPDKHRELSLITDPELIGIWHSSIGGDEELIDRSKINVDVSQTFAIRLKDWDAPLPGILHFLHSSVKDAIKLFESEF